MATKAKMKCADCHKAFKSNKTTQLLCDECEANRRKKKADGTTKPAPKVIPSASGTADGKPIWLANATVHDADHPYTTEIPPEERLPAPPRPPRPPVSPRASVPSRPLREPSAAKAPPAPRPPKPPRAPKPPTPPYVPTPTEIERVEQRYLELAQPEFDGIRTQIAQELHLPKRIVKEVVAALRQRDHLPSWWEAQTYHDTPETLARIRAAYLVHLPVPPVGIHRTIAKDLKLPTPVVYQGIGAIRTELGLPPYNPPDAHPEVQERLEAATAGAPPDEAGG